MPALLFIKTSQATAPSLPTICTAGHPYHVLSAGWPRMGHAWGAPGLAWVLHGVHLAFQVFWKTYFLFTLGAHRQNMAISA